MDKTNWHKFSQFGLLVLIILIIIGVWSYVQTELLSFSSNIDGVKVCQTENLKYFKITNFDSKSGQAQILCIRDDLAQSTFHKINLVKTNFDRDQNWEIVFTQKIYTDGNLFWPVYL